MDFDLKITTGRESARSRTTPRSKLHQLPPTYSLPWSRNFPMVAVRLELTPRRQHPKRLPTSPA